MTSCLAVFQLPFGLFRPGFELARASRADAGRSQQDSGEHNAVHMLTPLARGDDIRFLTMEELCYVFCFRVSDSTCARGKCASQFRAGARVNTEDYSEDTCSSVCCVSLIS